MKSVKDYIGKSKDPGTFVTTQNHLHLMIRNISQLVECTGTRLGKVHQANTHEVYYDARSNIYALTWNKKKNKAAENKKKKVYTCEY